MHSFNLEIEAVIRRLLKLRSGRRWAICLNDFKSYKNLTWPTRYLLTLFRTRTKHERRSVLMSIPPLQTGSVSMHFTIETLNNIK